MAIQRIEAIPALPPRGSDAHKGLFGSVLVIAGSRGMGGAAGFVGASALRSGAGLVTIATPRETQPIVACFEPSYMTYPLPQDDAGLIDFPAAEAVLDRLIQRATVVAIGPGLGRSAGVTDLARWCVESVGLPTVIDADALNALAEVPEPWSKLKREVVITPHPGEFARLIGKSTAEVQADREKHAVAYASGSDKLIVVLKGHETIVTNGKKVFTNTTGNPGMASGGSGDILTGVIAALLGQGLATFEAAQLGVYAHGLAGDVARDQNGVVGMIAGDIVDALADAFAHLCPD